MAVDDYMYRDTDSLILPSKSFYPVKIPVAHYQLRHYLSSPEQDILYYASRRDVFSLNTATKKQFHIASLPFEARCTASGYGWICVGGESNGHFAYIKVHDSGTEVDSSLPLSLSGQHPGPSLAALTPRVKLDKIGSEIVNSISIHKLETEPGSDKEDVVAVLTNNDRTVRIFSLTQSLELGLLDFPFPMNHATLSPNGQLLVAVGDLAQVYFFERMDRHRSSSTGKVLDVFSAHSDWSHFASGSLHVPTGSSTTGYFTTAWASSGGLCAVGSECGFITVYDTQVLRATHSVEEAVVQIIQSSRPDSQTGPGAVRTMCFAPQPWDLLIWSEDQGRVCVSDLRSGLLTRQILTLDPEEENLDTVDIIEDDDAALSSAARELVQEAEFIRGYRRSFGTEGERSAAVNFTTDYLEAAMERRRAHRTLGIVDSDDDPNGLLAHGLTAHERHILATLRTTRQRDDARERNSIVPRSINYAPPHPEGRRAATNASDFPALQGSERRENLIPSMSSLRDFLRERHALDSERRSYEPRRQASVVLSNTESSENSNSNTGAGRASRNDSQPGTDPWRTIEAAMAALPGGTPLESLFGRPDATSELRRLRQLSRARERIRAREADLGGYEFGLFRRGQLRPNWSPEHGVRTAGLAMSQDGRKLFAGTEEGIFEFSINVRERKFFPAVTPR